MALGDWINLGALLVAVAAVWIAYRERRARIAAERRLGEDEARGMAPFFTPDDEPFCIMAVGPNEIVRARDPNILSAHRHEVEKDLTPNTIIAMVVQNQGVPLRSAELKLDGQDAGWGRECKAHDGRPREWICYPYDPAKHGTNQQLTIRFETQTGHVGEHVYTLRHGCRALRRTKPHSP